MLNEVTFDDRSEHPGTGLEEDAIAPEMIREELRRIVTSRHFRTSRRGKEFLEYVVDRKITGSGDLLKERLIGVHLFGRKPDYATGEDPVVRVQAGDVRRRLESYYSDPEVHGEVVIQVPVGSYAPVFLSRKSPQPQETWPGTLTPSAHIKADAPALADILSAEGHGTIAAAPAASLSGISSELPGHADDPQPEAASTFPQDRKLGRHFKLWPLALLTLAGLALVGYLVIFSLHRSPEGTLKAFWSPASASTKSVLLCLPRPIVYRPSERLYDKYAASHPNAFATREQRRDQILPLKPTDTIQWGDMEPVRASGPGIGAVVAAVNISKLLAEQGIRFELRFGEEATYADMRDSPAVIVGGINTDWATQLTSESHFVFDESRESPNIRETVGAKRVWKMESHDGNITRDYGLVTRQLSGKAGQFLVQVAGVSHFGTEAASEFLASKKEFAAALHSESINLQKKNFQIVVSTDITAGRAGPPHVVAVGSW